MDGLGQGGDRARLGVPTGCAIAAVRDLPAVGEEQPRRTEARQGEAGEDGANVNQRDCYGWNSDNNGIKPLFAFDNCSASMYVLGFFVGLLSLFID